MNCPECTAKFSPEEEALLRTRKHCTLDCPVCDTLLLWKDGVLSDFHKAIHAECEDWPEDGKGTHSLKIGE